MSEFKVIETQEQLNAILEERINRAKDTVRKDYADYDDLKKFKAEHEGKVASLEEALTQATAKINDFDTEIAKYKEDIAERDKRIGAYETDSVKSRIAHEKGLPFAAVKFLQGNDEESIRTSADNLVSLFANNGGGNPRRNPEANTPSGKDAELLCLARDLTE